MDADPEVQQPRIEDGGNNGDGGGAVEESSTDAKPSALITYIKNSTVYKALDDLPGSTGVHILIVLIISILILINLVLGLYIIIRMVVDTNNIMGKPNILNKESPDYKAVLSALDSKCTNVWRFRLDEMFSKRCGGKYPFIAFIILSWLLVLTSFIYALTVIWKVRDNYMRYLDTMIVLGCLMLYVAIMASINTGYIASTFKGDILDLRKQYMQYNKICDNNIPKNMVNFMTALSVSPSNFFDRYAKVDDAMDLLPGKLDQENFKKVVFTINLYFHYCKIADKNSKTEALEALFKPSSIFLQTFARADESSSQNTNIEVNTTKYTDYLYRHGYDMSNHSADIVQYCMRNHADKLPDNASTIASEVQTQVGELVANLNSLSATFYPEDAYSKLRTMSMSIAIAQFSLPVMLYLLYKLFIRFIPSVKVEE